MRRRRTLLLVVALLVALLAYFPLRATVFAPRFDVPSIAATAYYRDAALLDRAWSLPAASTFERRVLFQSNSRTARFAGRQASRTSCAPSAAGYLESDDLVLVLDVNPSFGPWLVSSERLFRAVDSIDGSTSKKRGLLLIE